MNDITKTKTRQPLTDNDRWKWLHKSVKLLGEKLDLVHGAAIDSGHSAAVAAGEFESLSEKLEAIEKKLEALLENSQVS